MPSFVFASLTEERESAALPSAAKDIIAATQVRPDWDNLQVRPEGNDQFPLLNISWHAGYGFEVQCFETPESNSEFLATGKELSTPEVYVELGGQAQELWPKQLFVPPAVAVEALRFFLQTGRENPRLFWVAIDGFPRHTVPPRRGPPG